MIGYDLEKEFKGSIFIPELNVSGVRAILLFSNRKKIKLTFTTNKHIDDGNQFYLLKPIEVNNMIFQSDAGGSFFLTDISSHNMEVRANDFTYDFLIRTALFNPKPDLKEWDNFKIRKISVYTNNITKWLYPNIHVDYCIKRKDILSEYKSNFNINIDYKKKNATLNIYDSFSSKWEYIVANDTFTNKFKGLIHIENKSNDFTIDEADQIINNINFLLCILTAQHQYSKNIIFNDTISFYTETSSYMKEEKYKGNYLFNISTLNTAQVFNQIFDSCLNKTDKMYKKYHGLWTIFNVQPAIFIEDKFFRLFSMLDSIARSEEIKGCYATKIKTIRDKFLSDSAKAIIDIPDDTIKKLTDIRNSIAHADKLPEFIFEEGDAIYDKAYLFVMYLLWIDIGLNDQIIFQAISRTFYNLYTACNEEALTKYKKEHSQETSAEAK